MSTYSEKLKSPLWQKKRLEVMQRDEFACRDCNSKDATLHVHHCYYDKGNPWDTESGLLITLCRSCHEARHDGENMAKKALGRIFAAPDGKDAGSALAGILDFAASIKRQGRTVSISVSAKESST